MCETPCPQTLLEWYDRHARDLPWRVGPRDGAVGVRPDPYHVWLSEIMLQQTTVAAVKSYFETFTTRWPQLEAHAAAPDADVMSAWAGLGYYARARNLLKCARLLVAEHGGRFPDTRDALLKLPGIGPYTAAAIAAIACDRPATVVDGNVERVMARIFSVTAPLPGAKKTLADLAATLTPDHRPGDYAQAVMDLGATICTPRNPACGICPWRTPCRARMEGLAGALPIKSAKAPKQVRHGLLYILRRDDGAWLLETRPANGLLGGMLGWPGSAWVEDSPLPAPPIAADWADIPGEVRHTFTHFHLRLALRGAQVRIDAEPDCGVFIPSEAFDPAALPTVMRKAYALADNWFEKP
ncbi:MAG: A/G-specific adenine glycosylase [Pseudomonadota bacterium]